VTLIRTFGLDHLDLTVKDLARSVRFYTDVLSALGFCRLEEEKDFVWANAHLNIAIHPAHAAERETAFNRHRVGLHHVAFRAHSREDIDRFHEFLLSRAVVVLDPPREYPEYGSGYYALFFADPDGIKLELVHHPWGYWKRVLADGSDERPRHTPRGTS
jgi:catechol 2,3-dioxygenase-like lactoylglutathione lyase family enzyme